MRADRDLGGDRVTTHEIGPKPWEYTGENNTPVLHKEPLAFENVQLATRSYK